MDHVFFCFHGARYTDISQTAPLASAAEDRGLHWLAMLVAIGALGNTLTTVTCRRCLMGYTTSRPTGSPSLNVVLPQQCCADIFWEG